MCSDPELLRAAQDPALPYTERLALLDAMAAPDPGARALRGDVLRFLGRIDESEAAFSTLLDGDPNQHALATIGLANARAARADWAGAGALLEALVADAGLERRLVARAQAILASTWFNRHDLDKAEAALEKAAALQRALRDREGEAASVTSLGIVAFARGDRSGAFAFLDEGRALARRVGHSHWEAMASSYLAMLRHDAGELDAASALYDASIAALDHLGVRRAEGITLFGRAVLRVERGRFEAAEDDLREALSEERATSPDYEPLLAAALAIPAAARGDREARDHHLRFARQCAARRGDRFVPLIQALEAALAGGSAISPIATIEGRLLARAVAALATRGPRRTLRLGDDAAWFAIDDGPRVDLARRRPLRRVLVALVERHREPDRPALSVDALIRAGWPDERLVPSAGAARLYTAVATLRRMGLDGVIERRGEGYALAADVEVAG
jgi:tetratricopeptide (TPR) repeat protein